MKLVSTYKGPIKKAKQFLGVKGKGGGGGMFFSLIQEEAGFEKLCCDFMGHVKIMLILKKIICPPAPCSIHNECSLRMVRA